MSRLLLNTIALDPNRWSAEKKPFFRLADLLPSIAGAGFHDLEVWQYHLSALNPEQIDDLRERAGELVVRFRIVGVYPVLHLGGAAADAEAAEIDRLTTEAAAIGAHAVKFFAGRLGSAGVDEAAYARSIRFARRMAASAARYGLLLTAETHPDTLCDTVEATLRFLDDADAENLRLCFQPFDFADTDRAVADYESLRDSIVHMHLQGRRKDRMSLLEDADIDYRRLFEAMARNGFDGDLSIEFVQGCVVERPEDFDPRLVLENARRDRAYVEREAAVSGLPLENR